MLVVPLVNALELLQISGLFLLGFPLLISTVVSSDYDDDSNEDSRKENGDDHHNNTDNNIFVVSIVIGKWLHRHVCVCEYDL